MAVLVLIRPAAAADPLETVRRFARADGRGDRLHVLTWGTVAQLVAWELEPAWDRVRLIRGYEIGTPRVEADTVTVDVTYTIAAEVGAGRVARHERLEPTTYHLARDGAGRWRMRGPPPVPHVFTTEADADAMAASLDPESGTFLTASKFVWKLLEQWGQHLPYRPTAELPAAATLTAVATPQPGDLVLYYDGAEPYHVGVLESEALVVSATLNAGVRRAPVAAFAGEVRYLRPPGEARRGASAPAAQPPTPQSAPLPATPAVSDPRPEPESRSEVPETVSGSRRRRGRPVAAPATRGGAARC